MPAGGVLRQCSQTLAPCPSARPELAPIYSASAKTRHLEVGHQIQLAKGSAGPISCLHTGPWHNHETCRFSSDSASGDIHSGAKTTLLIICASHWPSVFAEDFLQCKDSLGRKNSVCSSLFRREQFSQGQQEHRCSGGCHMRRGPAPAPLGGLSHIPSWLPPW